MTSAISEGKLVFGGVPTNAEVNILLNRYDDAKPGTVIPYGEVEELIHTERDDSRFRTITSRWRRMSFRKHNSVIICIPNVGFKIAAPDERIQEASSKVTKGRRAITSGSVIAGTTPTRGLSDANIRVRDHIASIPARLRLAELTAPKPLDS